MATITRTNTSLQIRFRPVEKIAGLVRDLDLPLAGVSGVHVEDDGLSAARGLRAPGLALPGIRKVGTWRGRRRKVLVSVRRDQPALRLTLTGQRFDEVLIGADDAATLAEDLRAHVG